MTLTTSKNRAATTSGEISTSDPHQLRSLRDNDVLLNELAASNRERIKQGLAPSPKPVTPQESINAFLNALDGMVAILDRDDNKKITSSDLKTASKEYIKDLFPDSETGANIPGMVTRPSRDPIQNIAQMMELARIELVKGSATSLNPYNLRDMLAVMKDYNHFMDCIDRNFPEGISREELVKQFDGFGNKPKDGVISIEEVLAFFSSKGGAMKKDFVESLGSLLDSASQFCIGIGVNKELATKYNLDKETVLDIGHALGHLAKAANADEEDMRERSLYKAAEIFKSMQRSLRALEE